jgi:hypothetical protein
MKRNYIIILIVLAIILIAAIIYAIAQYSSWSASEPQQAAASSSPLATPSQQGQATTSFADPGKKFSFDYPSQFTVSGMQGTPSQSWQYNSTSTGNLEATLVIPKSYEPQTNFSDARFTVGDSDAPQALEQCAVAPGNNENMAISRETINGIPFNKITYGDAGAGNFYEVTSYQAIRNGRCYAVEYVIHSTNIGNYPPEAGISQFDKAKVQDILEGIVHSFKFT